MRKCAFFIFLVSLGFAHEFEQAMMHYKLHDFTNAYQECENGLRAHPESQKLKELKLRVLSASGRLDEAIALIRTTRAYSTIDNANDLSLVESLAWGVLSNVTDTTDGMQLMALVGAFYTRDAKAVEMIYKNLHSSNALLRAHAIKASTMYRDDILKFKLQRLLSEEKNYYVRLEVIRSLGSLKAKACSEALKDVISSEQSQDEEKFHAIAALVDMYEKIESDEFMEMASSKRSGLRHAACEIAMHLEYKQALPEIFNLLDDPTQHVQIAAMNTIAMLGVEGIDLKKLRAKLQRTIESDAYALSLTAEWLAKRLNLNYQNSKLKSWLEHKNQQARLAAAAALVRCGDKMKSEMVLYMHHHSDPFVRLNLALGVLQTNTLDQDALKQIETILTTHRGLLMRSSHQNPLFSSIAKSEVRHNPITPQYPEVVDQMVRLELINVLTLFNYENASSMLKELLQNKSWRVIGSTATLLMEEGELESIELVKELIHDPDRDVALQAALVVAFLGKDPSVVSMLMDAYEGAEWEQRIQILEALGRIGEHAAIPFLIETLEEPFQLLKIVAASSLIQCLYH